MVDRNTNWVRFDWRLSGREFDFSVADGYRLRPASSADLDAIARIVAAAYATDPQWDGLTADIERRVMARVTDRITDPTAHFLLAVYGQKAVGLNGVALKSETKMNLITGVCVEPMHQARGLATALLGGTLTWLRDNWLSEATVTTEADAVAVKVYAGFGAVRTMGVAYSDSPKTY